MSPKHKLVTIAWCCVTMTATMILSHGHLILKEIMLHWPTEDSWEGRLETALYTQGGLVLAASVLIGAVLMLRGFLAIAKEDQLSRRERIQREQHERAASVRHEAMMETLGRLAGGSQPKKSHASGVKPR